MKRHTIIATAWILLTLCACSTTVSKDDTQSAPELGSTADSVQTVQTPEYPTFGESAEQMTKFMGESLENIGAYNAFASEPYISDDQSDIFGNIRSYTYSVCDGMSVTLYESKDAKLCYYLFLHVNWDKMKDDDAFLFGQYTASAIFASEKDVDKIEDITSDLGLLNAFDAYADCVELANSDAASYTYTTQNKITVFDIIAK